MNTVGTTTITSHAYSLDDEGNRTGLDEFVEGITAPSTTDSFGMSYDGLERLKAVTGAVAEGFTLDPASNLASRTGPTKTFNYDTSDRLTSDGTSTHSWDDADRLTAAGSETYAYDPLSRLVFSEALVTTSSGSVMAELDYTYNGDGLLASRTQDGGTPQSFLWDPLTPLARLLQIGGERIVYGLGPLYGVKADGSTIAFARDGMKSVRAEVNGSGAVTKSFRYTAYGDLQAASPTSATPTFVAYNSQLRDGSGLVYLRARWYEPATGRFITRDPLLGDAASPATLNAFGYGGGNPLTMSDPSGMLVELDGSGRGDCEFVSTCGEFARPQRDTFIREAAAAVAATQSSNPWIAGTGYIEIGAAGVAAGALAVAGGARLLASSSPTLWPAASSAPLSMGGTVFTTHALERMSPHGLIQRGTEMVSRGIPPSVVFNAIAHGAKSIGSHPGTIRHTYENVVVITTAGARRVITTWHTGR